MTLEPLPEEITVQQSDMIPGISLAVGSTHRVTKLSDEEQQLLGMATCVMKIIKINETTGKRGVGRFRGHVVNLVQDVKSWIGDKLPRTLDTLNIKVVRPVGSQSTKVVRINNKKIQIWIVLLRRYNSLYQNISVDIPVMNALPDEWLTHDHL